MFPLIRHAALGLAFIVVGCTPDSLPTESLQAGPGPSFQAAPANLTTVSLGSTSIQLWPYTGTSFSGVPQDPINLVFAAGADPRNVRSALLSLDGNRSVAPFTQSQLGMLLAGVAQGCTWSDAIGSHQVTYSDVGDWAGSAIQLECGDYVPFRFHIRLFEAGEWTVGNAHVDVIIPGTPQHEVISWEAGEAFIAMELVRSGLLLSAPGLTTTLNATPTFGAIRPQIYNGLPAPLRLLTGGPAAPVAAPVPLGTDGRATALNLGDAPPAGGSSKSFTLTFGQFIPKPFCADNGELVRIDGPAQFRQDVWVDGSGNLHSQTVIDGELQVRDFDPSTGAVGEAFEARVKEHYSVAVGDPVTLVQATSSQQLRQEQGWQSLQQRLKVSSHGENQHSSTERCGPV